MMPKGRKRIESNATLEVNECRNRSDDRCSSAVHNSPCSTDCANEEDGEDEERAERALGPFDLYGADVGDDGCTLRGGFFGHPCWDAGFRVGCAVLRCS